MPSVQEIEQALGCLAPKELAQSWDNVGLLVGKPEAEVRKVLVTLDITEAVADEAKQLCADLIVAHHPVIFHPINRVTSEDITGRVLLKLIECGLSAICMHTNLDAAKGGVNDALAAALGLEQVDLLEGGDGIARQGLLPEVLQPPDFLAHVKSALCANGLRYTDSKKPIHKVAVGGGACGTYFQAAVEQGCDAFVTADVKYNQFLDAAALGLTLIDAGHFPTEDVVCNKLISYLAQAFPELVIQKSPSHQEITQYYT